MKSPTGSDAWSTHDAFDAEVGVTVEEIGLYLVAAHDNGDGLRRSLAEVGAQLVASLSDLKVLAVMRFAGFQQLLVNPAIRLVGPVIVDADRFARFQSLIGTPPEPD